jgi:hypothetical protein
MNLDLKSFALGVAFAAVVGCFTYIARVKPVEAALVHEKTDLSNRLAHSEQSVTELQNMLVSRTQDLARAQIQLSSLEAPEASSPAYTLLYDPAPAAASSGSVFDMLNLARPGLGTVIGKISQAVQQQRPQGNPRWLIPGFVKPRVNGDGSGSFYSWANLQSGDVETFPAQGTTLSGQGR